MLIVIIMILVLLALGLTFALTYIFHLSGEEKKRYRSLVTVRGGTVVDTGGADSNELIYGEYQNADTVLEGDRLRPQYVLNLKQMITGQSYSASFVDYIDIGRFPDKETCPAKGYVDPPPSCCGNLHVDGHGISRRHARFSVRNEILYVEDLGSTNHTFAGNYQVKVPTRVYNGDIIYLGATPFTVSAQLC